MSENPQLGIWTSRAWPLGGDAAAGPRWRLASLLMRSLGLLLQAAISRSSCSASFRLSSLPSAGKGRPSQLCGL
ncbi:hypothetical protein NL676_000252 [Syzygium grande]|nr:hypothetical protein NL676_000252 [Syzygium grande]